MEAITILKELGFTVEPWSSWEGHIGMFKFCRGNGQWLGILNTKNSTISPFHGYYGGYLKSIAKSVSYDLVQ